MKLVTTAAEINHELTRLLRECSSCQVAVAWATVGFDAFQRLKKHSTKISRMVVGTSFFQTHPAFIEAFQTHPNVRFVLKTVGVFHPKLYFFEKAGGVEHRSASSEAPTSPRVLAMKRPDTFMCFNSRNSRRLCKDIGISRSVSYEAYWDSIIARVMDSTWWNSPRPEPGIEREVWEARTAFLDAILYDGTPI